MEQSTSASESCCPAEILYHLFSFLSPPSLLAASAVSTEWQAVAEPHFKTLCLMFDPNLTLEERSWRTSWIKLFGAPKAQLESRRWVERSYPLAPFISLKSTLGARAVCPPDKIVDSYCSEDGSGKGWIAIRNLFSGEISECWETGILEEPEALCSPAIASFQYTKEGNIITVTYSGQITCWGGGVPRTALWQVDGLSMGGIGIVSHQEREWVLFQKPGSEIGFIDPAYGEISGGDGPHLPASLDGRMAIQIHKTASGSYVHFSSADMSLHRDKRRDIEENANCNAIACLDCTEEGTPLFKKSRSHLIAAESSEQVLVASQWVGGGNDALVILHNRRDGAGEVRIVSLPESHEISDSAEGCSFPTDAILQYAITSIDRTIWVALAHTEAVSLTSYIFVEDGYVREEHFVLEHFPDTFCQLKWVSSQWGQRPTLIAGSTHHLYLLSPYQGKERQLLLELPEGDVVFSHVELLHTRFGLKIVAVATDDTVHLLDFTQVA